MFIVNCLGYLFAAGGDDLGCYIQNYETTDDAVVVPGIFDPSNMCSVSQGLIYTENCTCRHTETEAADQTCYLTHSQLLTAGQPVPALTQQPKRLAGQPLEFVYCLTSQQHATVYQGRICSDNFTRCRTEIEVADQTFYLTQSQYTDTVPTSPSTDPITPGAW